LHINTYKEKTNSLLLEKTSPKTSFKIKKLTTLLLAFKKNLFEYINFSTQLIITEKVIICKTIFLKTSQNYEINLDNILKIDKLNYMKIERRRLS